MRDKRIFVAVIGFMVMIACSKNKKDETPPNPDNSIAGSWQLSETYLSPGSIVSWQKINNGSMLIFQTDSTYEIRGTTPLFWPDLQASKKGKLGSTVWQGANATYMVPANSKDTAFFHPVRIHKDTLELAGFCFEGCISRFRKIN